MIRSTHDIRWLALLCALPACRAGSKYEHADHLYYQGAPEYLLEEYNEAEGDRGIDALLGRMKLLSATMLLEDWESAEIQALEVSTEVNVYLAGQEGERDALSTFGTERDKPFKGEPHEQAMADFYLGLLRYRHRDFEGALSCFRSALNKDRGTYLLPVEVEAAKEDHENTRRYLYDADYATFELFGALCWKRLGDPERADEALRRAKSLQPELGDLFDTAVRDETNVLIVVEAGSAPEKLATGPRGAVLDYQRGPETPLESVRLDGRELPFGLTDDLYYQATTLGGRGIDRLNTDKARRQEALSAVGKAATIAGAIVAASGEHRRSKRQRNIGLAIMVAGILMHIFSEAAIDASADTRAWTLLPGALYLAVGRSLPGDRHRLEITSRGAAGRRTEAREDIVLEERDNLLLVRLLPGAPSWRHLERGERRRNGPP